jgi:hypothetical protein
MSSFAINPCKLLTVTGLLDCTFPCNQVHVQLGNKFTPYITSLTIGYLHAFIINSVTKNHAETPYARAFRNETKFCKEFNAMPLVIFAQNCALDW